MVEHAEEPDTISARTAAAGDGGDVVALRGYIDAAVAEHVALFRSDLTAEALADADRVSRLDRHLAQTVARLTEILDAARRDSIERAPIAMSALRTELKAALAALDRRFTAVEAVQAVAAAPDEAMTVRVTAVEQTVRGAKAAVAAEITRVRAEAAAAASDSTARIDRLERETSERLAALEQRGEADALRGASVTAAELDTWISETLRTEMRAEAAEETEDLIAMVGQDLTQRIDRLARQVAEVTGSIDSTDSALARIDHEIVHLRESVEADRAALAAKVAELETSLATQVADWRAEVDEQLAGMVRQTGPAPAEPVRSGGGRRKVRGADVERLVREVEAWRAESVGEQEFFTLRAELEKVVSRRIASAKADVQHRVEVLEAVVADAAADAGDTDALRSDLRTLQEQVATLQKSATSGSTPAKAKRKPPDPV